MRLLLLTALLAALAGCDTGKAQAESGPRDVFGMPGCTAQEINFGGQRTVVVVRCPGCSSTSEAHKQGKTELTNTVLECPAGCLPPE